MEIEKLQAYGRVLKIFETALERKGKELKHSDFQTYCKYPNRILASLWFQVTDQLSKDTDLDMQLGEQLNIFRLEDIQNKEPISGEDSGALLIAYYKYDVNQLTIEEAAKDAGVSQQAIHDAIRAGKINSIKRRKNVYVFKKSLDNYKK